MKSKNPLIRLCCYAGFYIPEAINRISWLALIRTMCMTAIPLYHSLKVVLGFIMISMSKLQTLGNASLLVYTLSGALIMIYVNINYKNGWKLVTKLLSLNNENAITPRQLMMLRWWSIGLTCIPILFLIVFEISALLVYKLGYITEIYLEMYTLPFSFTNLSTVYKDLVFLFMNTISNITGMQLLCCYAITMYSTICIISCLII